MTVETPFTQKKTVAITKASTKFITGPIRITNSRFHTLCFAKALGSSFEIPFVSSSP